MFVVTSFKRSWGCGGEVTGVSGLFFGSFGIERGRWLVVFLLYEVCFVK